MKKRILLGGYAALMALASCTVSHQYYTTGGNVGTKVGVASAKSGDLKADFTLQAAAKNGGITKIATVDVIVKSYFIFMKGTTTVTGE